MQKEMKRSVQSDILVDEQGNFRYFVVDLASGFSVKVLLPVGVTRIDYNANRVYATGMTRQQAVT